MLNQNRRFVRELRLAVSEDRAELARHLTTEVEMMHLGRNSFSEKYLRQLIKAILSPRFARSSKAGTAILMGLHLQWSRLSPAQRRRLASALEKVYPRVTPKAWMLCFTISELIGTRMHDSQGLDIFTRLLAVGRDHCRKFVPHGFEHVVAESDDPEVARSALLKLNMCASDRSEAVRDEAQVSLQRLLARGKA